MCTRVGGNRLGLAFFRASFFSGADYTVSTGALVESDANWIGLLLDLLVAPNKAMWTRRSIRLVPIRRPTNKPCEK